MTTQTQSVYAATHQAFWEAISDTYLVGAEHGSVKNAFIGYVIRDWVNDINFELVTMLPDQIIACWDSYENYDKWLLRSMVHSEEIIEQIEQMYYDNEEEVLEELGDNDPSYVNDFSADFYYTKGINVPAE